MIGLTLAQVARAATGGLVTAVWQGAVLAAVVGLGLRMVPKTPAAMRFAIWFAVFGLVAVLPLAGLRNATGYVGGTDTPWMTIDVRWCFVVFGAWAMASAMRAVTLVWAVFRVRALWKRAVPLELDEAEFADVLGEGRRAELCVSDEVDRPTVIGFFAPRIVIPSWLVEKLTRAELAQIVLHETGHLNRADDWMNLLQKIALVVVPLNPALAWVERRLCFERELACDEQVLATTGAPKAYAECLARVAEHRLGRRGLVLALGALGRESELGRRVGRILRRGDGMKPVQAKFVMAGAMAGLVVAGVGFARLPQVIGFASAGPSVASVVKENVRVVPKSAMYRDVSFRVAERQIVERPVAAREVPQRAQGVAPQVPMAIPAGALIRRIASPVVRHADVARMVNLSVDVSPGLTDVARPQMVQWVVVTEWRDANGREYVLTSADGTVVNEQSADEAAVPVPVDAEAVRDGWVWFEL